MLCGGRGRLALLLVLFVSTGSTAVTGVPAGIHGEHVPERSADPWIDPALSETLAQEPATPHVLLLGFRTVPGPDTHRWLERHGFVLHAFEHVPVIVVMGAAHDLDTLRRTPGLVSIGSNQELDWHQTPTGRQGNFAATGDALTRAARARSLGFDGSGIGVAVIDSGTNGAHPGLLPKPLGGPLAASLKVVAGDEPATNSAPPSPLVVQAEHDYVTDRTSGHGTHTTHIVAGHPVGNWSYGGRAPGVDLVSIAVGEGIFVLWAVTAFDWIIEHKDTYNIRIISNSYGIAGAYGALSPVNLASRAAYDAGIAVVFSAGNSGPGPDSMNTYAQAPHVLGVGAATPAGAIAEFSARGGPESAKPGPDLVAPGHNVISARSGPVGAYWAQLRGPQFETAAMGPSALPLYRTESGTSMAAPQVAGIAALVLQANPDLGVDDLYHVLTDTARPIMGFDRDATGAGLVDAEAAVRAARGLTPGGRDAVEPLVAAWDDTSRVYPFHGALVGAPAEFYPIRQPLHVPIRLPAEALDVAVSWSPRAPLPVAPPDDSAASHALRLQLFAPDGQLVEELLRTDFLTGPGVASFHVDAARLAAHPHPSWTAGHWKLVLHATAGDIVYDVEARVTYAEAILPVPIHDPQPPPPPPPVQREPRGHIEIVGNDDFTAANGVRSGSGTAADPFIIANWDVDAEGLQGLALRGTTAHVVIRDVAVHGTTRPCLVLESAQNVRVTTSEMSDCSWGFYVIEGSGDIVIEDNEVRRVDQGMSAWATTDLVVRRNLFEDVAVFGYSQAAGLPGVPQEHPQNARLSGNILLEGNTFRGATNDLRISDSTATNVRVHDNGFDGPSGIVLSMGAHHATIDGTDWGPGVPHYRYIAGITEVEPGLRSSTIVDAGEDRTAAADGYVCFAGMRAFAAPPNLVLETEWVFGDGASVSGDLTSCHTYADPTRTHEATLLVTVQREDTTVETLRDTVLVHPAV